MKTYEVTLSFDACSETYSVDLQASSPEAAIQAATKPAWYEIATGVFVPAARIDLVRVRERVAQAA